MAAFPQNAAEVKATLDYLQSLQPLGGVCAVLLLGGAQSLYFAITKPWCPRVAVRRGGRVAYEAVHVTLEEAATSRIVPRATLLAWRLTTLLFIVAIGVGQTLRIGSAWHMRFYTVWNWYLLGLYFALASLASATYRRALPRRAAAVGASPEGGEEEDLAKKVHDLVRGPPGSPAAAAGAAGVVVQATAAGNGSNGAEPAVAERVGGGFAGRWLAEAVCVLFHINATTVFIIDFTTWTVLVPMLVTYNVDREAAARFSKLFYNTTSYSQHGLNAVIMMAELMLSNVPFRLYMVGHVGTWSLIFSLWAFLHYSLSGEWLYPFLDANKPTAPLAYLGLYASHWAFFMIVLLVFKLKGRLLGPEKAVVPVAATPAKKHA